MQLSLYLLPLSERSYLIPFLISSLCLAASTAMARPPESGARLQVEALSPEEAVRLPGALGHWRPEAIRWYTAEDPERRRRQMREMTRALKRPCYYCHTRNFKEYTDQHLISLQMMAISASYSLKCSDCHLGQRGLSALGAQSLVMWRVTAKNKKTCADCHVKGRSLKVLTPEGERSRARIAKEVAQLAPSLSLPPALIRDFVKQIVNPSTQSPAGQSSAEERDSPSPEASPAPPAQQVPDIDNERSRD